MYTKVIDLYSNNEFNLIKRNLQNKLSRWF